MSYIPKYIIKRMFKKNECLKLVKSEGDEWVSLTMLNVISPIEIPEGDIDLGGANLPADIGNFLKIKINDTDLPVTPEILVNDVSLWTEGEKFTWKTIFEDHAAGGKTIAVGGKITILIRKGAFPAATQEQMVDGADTEVEVIAEGTNIKMKVKFNGSGDFDPANP